VVEECYRKIQIKVKNKKIKLKYQIYNVQKLMHK